jgi:hypothetical protein
MQGTCARTREATSCRCGNTERAPMPTHNSVHSNRPSWHGTAQRKRRWLNWCGAVGGSTTESSAGGSEAGGHSGRRRSRSSMARTRRPHGTRASAIHLCGPAAAIAVVDRWYTDCATASVLSHIDEHDDPIRASTSVIAKAYSSPRALSVGQTCTSKLPSAVTERA